MAHHLDSTTGSLIDTLVDAHVPVLATAAHRVVREWSYASTMIVATRPDRDTVRFEASAWVGLTGRRFARLPDDVSEFSSRLAPMVTAKPGDRVLAIMRLTRMPQIEDGREWGEHALHANHLLTPIAVEALDWGGFSLFADLDVEMRSGPPPAQE